MIPNIPSRATQDNKGVKELKRTARQNNLQWLAAALKADPPDGALVLLVGGSDELSLRLRVAQSHLRSDMTPSAWSHVALVGALDTEAHGKSVLVEVPLDPPAGFGWAPRTNAALVDTPLSRYADPKHYPNIALFCLPGLNGSDVSNALYRFVRDRGVFDCCDLLLRWLAFCWGTGHAPNPLFEGMGIPSAVLAERLVGAAGYDLSPGVANLASCPEAIWQGARWWHDHHEQYARSAAHGRFFVGHTFGYFLEERKNAGPGVVEPTVTTRRRRTGLPSWNYLAGPDQPNPRRRNPAQ